MIQIPDDIYISFHCPGCHEEMEPDSVTFRHYCKVCDKWYEENVVAQMSNQGKKLWYIRVKGLSEMPAKAAQNTLDEIARRVREWVNDEDRRHPLVIPDTIEICTPTDQWEHKVIQAPPYTALDLEGEIQALEKDGWQVAGCSGNLVILKRPAAPELDADTLKVTRA